MAAALDFRKLLLATGFQLGNVRQSFVGSLLFVYGRNEFFHRNHGSSSGLLGRVAGYRRSVHALYVKHPVQHAARLVFRYGDASSCLVASLGKPHPYGRPSIGPRQADGTAWDAQSRSGRRQDFKPGA